jgi:hypothetical protein
MFLLPYHNIKSLRHETFQVFSVTKFLYAHHCFLRENLSGQWIEACTRVPGAEIKGIPCAPQGWQSV